MTKITIFKKNDLFLGFESIGHSGYENRGKDIVCSAISTALQICVIELGVLKLKFDLKKDEKKGYLYCKLKEDEAQKAQVAFKTLEIALLDLESQFAKYLKLEVKDEVN